MKTIENGGTIWGDQFAKLIRDYYPEMNQPVLYEVGAFDGNDAKLFKEVIPGTEVFMFEASPRTFQNYLSQTTIGEAFHVAITDKNDSVEFNESDDAVLSSLYDRSEYHSGKKVIVTGSRLDTFQKKYSLPFPDVVKIDVEGGTWQALKGMGELLNHVSVLYVETEEKDYFPEQKKHKEVARFLTEQGFDCILLHRNDGQNDSIWIRRES